jgi:hypothetical protein
MQDALRRWNAWFRDLEAKGHVVSLGQPLCSEEAAVVTNANGSFTDGPYAETKDIVGGYSVIKAKDLQEAINLTQGHPLFEIGGIIEVRQVQELP